MDETSKTEKAIAEFSKRELGDAKVLMVEDDPFITELVIAKLSGAGCVPYSTLDGSEVLSLAEQFKPDAIILDLMLPGMSGEDILTALKGNDELKSIPVIVFSNKSEDSDIENIMNLGAAEYFIKASTDLNRLTEVVKQLAQKKA